MRLMNVNFQTYVDFYADDPSQVASWLEEHLSNYSEFLPLPTTTNRRASFSALQVQEAESWLLNERRGDYSSPEYNIGELLVKYSCPWPARSTESLVIDGVFDYGQMDLYRPGKPLCSVHQVDGRPAILTAALIANVGQYGLTPEEMLEAVRDFDVMDADLDARIREEAAQASLAPTL